MSTIPEIVGTIKGFLPDWPEWALDILLSMAGLLLITSVLSLFYTPEDEKADSSSSSAKGSKEKDLHKEFDRFRHKYIIVYLVIMLADWMQGTHMYTLYLSYNVNISALFLTGFLSGAFFAPFLGSAVDKFGRKNSCIVYCVLEIIINCLEHSTNFTILLLGRIMGGVSTNLLFSAFESWMTTEHRKRGFPEEWLSRTYSEVSHKKVMHIWENFHSTTQDLNTFSHHFNFINFFQGINWKWDNGCFGWNCFSNP